MEKAVTEAERVADLEMSASGLYDCLPGTVMNQMPKFWRFTLPWPRLEMSCQVGAVGEPSMTPCLTPRMERLARLCGFAYDAARLEAQQRQKSRLDQDRNPT